MAGIQLRKCEDIKGEYFKGVRRLRRWEEGGMGGCHLGLERWCEGVYGGSVG